MKEQRQIVLDPAAIRALSDDEVEQAIVDTVLSRIDQDRGREYEVVLALPAGYRVVYSTWVLEAEVSNGGFLQYFYNSRCEFIDEALEGLERLEAGDHLSVFEEAVVRITEEVGRLEPFWKEGTLEGFAASYSVSTLNELDKKWFALEDLSATRIAYIRNHVSHFEPDSAGRQQSAAAAERRETNQQTERTASTAGNLRAVAECEGGAERDDVTPTTVNTSLQPKTFPGFANLYSLDDPVANRPYRGKVDWHDMSVEVSRAELAPRGTLSVGWAMGSATPSEIIWTTSLAVIVHARIIDIFDRNGFTGWTTHPVQVSSKSGELIHDYFVLGISGRCGPVDLSRSAIELREYPGGWVPHFRGHYFAPDTWDGSDLFMHSPDALGNVSLARFITDPVRKALKRAAIPNLRIDRLTDITADVAVYKIGLTHLLPADFDAMVSDAYRRAGVPRPSWV
jgi:hypothetical protein